MPKSHSAKPTDDSTSGRIMALLRHDGMTVDELARASSLTGNAIRQQLALLERDGLVRQAGQRRGPSKPARIYALTPEAELLFSHAYVPVLTRLLQVLEARLEVPDFDTVMREVGRALATGNPRPGGTVRQRAEAASELLNTLGGLSRVEEHDGRLLIRGAGCPLAAATVHHPQVCSAIETLLSDFTGLAVAKCCDYEGRPRCCFELGAEKVA